MIAEPTELDGVVQLQPAVFNDDRGSFVKTFQRDQFRELGLEFEPREQYFSMSHRDVIRGMHFQVPPADHAKLVFCLQGAVLDVVLDLRKASRTFQKFTFRELSELNRTGLFIPRGCAHGFISLTEPSLVMYQTGSVYDPARDRGVRWDSFGFPWPITTPILSARDRAFPRLAEFVSPF
jgi:dTDP-4-dehydrorhamnose 3,5-epimerase